jgi:hypothetical protein
MTEEINKNCMYCGFPVYGGNWGYHPECKCMLKNLDELAEDIVKGPLPHHRSLIKYMVTKGGWDKATLHCILMAKIDQFYYKVCHLVPESTFSPEWKPEEFLPLVEWFLFGEL